jgi:hypothetical protein
VRVGAGIELEEHSFQMPDKVFGVTMRCHAVDVFRVRWLCTRRLMTVRTGGLQQNYRGSDRCCVTSHASPHTDQACYRDKRLVAKHEFLKKSLSATSPLLGVNKWRAEAREMA